MTIIMSLLAGVGVVFGVLVASFFGSEIKTYADNRKAIRQAEEEERQKIIAQGPFKRAYIELYLSGEHPQLFDMENINARKIVQSIQDDKWEEAVLIKAERKNQNQVKKAEKRAIGSYRSNRGVANNIVEKIAEKVDWW